MLTDSFGRALCYLRVSLTDRCNLRCFYCMPEEGVPSLPHAEILRFEEIETILRVAVRLGIKSVRLTGGEPLVRRGIAILVDRLARIPGLEDLALTTNGTLFAPLSRTLRDAGLTRVNIGLPSLDRVTYAKLSRRDQLPQALEGLEAALANGFSPVKVNVVVLKGINDDLAPFLRFAQEWPVDVRFIEYMPIGPLASQTYYLPAKEIKDRLRTLAPLEIAETPIGWGPAQHYCRTPGAVGRLAVLAPVSEHYCPLCNRLRLTADGHLRLCLFSDLEIDLKPALRPEPNESMIEQCFRRATEEKPRCMPSEYGEKHRCMVQIGG